MIPECLRLDTQQREKLKRFVAHVQSTCEAPVEEETCTIDSPLNFEVYSTGWGDCITVKMYFQECCLMIDDDGEIVPDEW